MAAAIENGGVSLILLNCDGNPISSGDDTIQRIVVDRTNLPVDMQQFPENELALQQIIGMPEGNFAVVHLQGSIIREILSASDDLEHPTEESPDKAEDVKDENGSSSVVEWSHKMTLLLLDLYRIHLNEFKDSKVRKKAVWGLVASGLEQAGFGAVTWRACAKKFYNLRSTYHGMLENQRKVGCKKWPYFDLFKDMLGASSTSQGGEEDEDLGQILPTKRRRKSGIEADAGDPTNFIDKDQTTNMANSTILWLTEIVSGAPVGTQLKIIENAGSELPSQSQECEDKSGNTAVEWTHNLTMVLLELYQAHLNDFKNDRIRKKSVWARIASGIQSAGYANMTWEACEKKFRNLKCTYRAIVESKKNERGRTKWPYFDIFDELFHNSEAGRSADVLAVDQANGRNDSGLEMECSSVPITLGVGETDKSHSAKRSGFTRKRKIVPPRTWFTDFIMETPKSEDTRLIDESSGDIKFRDGMAEFDEESPGSTVEWTRSVTLLLLEQYRKHCDEFENGAILKKAVWGKIASALIAAGCSNMTWEICEKKFRNLRSTYRTIIENSKTTGQIRTKWPYLEYFHNLFGQLPMSCVDVGVDAVLIKPDLSQNDSTMQTESGSVTTTNGVKETTGSAGVQKEKCTEPTISWLADFMTEMQKSMDTRLKLLENKRNDSTSEAGGTVENKTPSKLNSEWTHSMTLLLLDLYRLHFDEFSGANVQRKSVWSRISSDMQAAGFENVTWNMCEKKFRNLKCRYWTIVENNRRTGRSQKKWPYYKRFHELFDGSPVASSHNVKAHNLDNDLTRNNSHRPPSWFVKFAQEVKSSEESMMNQLRQMHAEQKQHAAEQIAAIHELSDNVRQLIDKLKVA